MRYEKLVATTMRTPMPNPGEPIRQFRGDSFRSMNEGAKQLLAEGAENQDQNQFPAIPNLCAVRGIGLAAHSPGRRVVGTWYGRYEPPSGGPFFLRFSSSDPPQSVLHGRNLMPRSIESRLVLTAKTAADLMSGPVASIPLRANFHEAVAFFIDHNVTVAPVIGERGEPVGVLSMADVLIHVRESAPTTNPVAPATAGNLMTPTVFSVTPETPAVDVIHDMLRSKVHHLFVIDADGKIVGVISACDVLQHLE